jgi:N-acetylglucosamine kinase-like BadF-type ATPase
MPQYFLGVDGGQSGTTAVIGDETGRVVGVGHSGPANLPGDPEARQKFADAIRTAVEAACSEAGIHPGTRFARACLGLSGGVSGREALIRRVITSDGFVFSNDAEIALTGALPRTPGIVVIAGTGSIAFGRNKLGQVARAGGWGYVFGDEGGGFWIARQALRSALRFEEGWGPPTALRAILLDSTGARNINDLMHRCYTPEFPRRRIASFALTVNQAAEAGDPEALAILSDAARELAALAQAVRNQLFGPGEPVPCAPVGGVFHSRLLRSSFRSKLAPGLEFSTPRYDPARGALLEALGQPNLVRGLG